MKVAVYEGTRAIRLEERERPYAGPNEVVVKVKYCGICGTDVHAYMHGGQWAPGTVFGHEIVGTATEVGKGVTGSSIGDRVAVKPSASCGECYFCRRGRPNICVHAFDMTLGLTLGLDGGLAEYVRVRYPKDLLYNLPDNVTFEDGVLIDPMGVAFGGIRQSRFRIGDNVVVVGAGAVGLFVVKLLQIAGARHITVLDYSEKKRNLAVQFGADATFDPLEEGANLSGMIAETYNGVGADVVYECAGVPEAVRTSVSLVKSGGQVVLIGASEEEMPVREIDLVMREIELKASITYKEEFGLCLDFLSQGKIDTNGMLSDIINLDDVVEKGFERLAHSRDLVKVAVAP